MRSGAQGEKASSVYQLVCSEEVVKSEIPNMKASKLVSQMVETGLKHLAFLITMMSY